MTDKQISNERRQYEYKSVFTYTDNTTDNNDKIMENLHKQMKLADGSWIPIEEAIKAGLISENDIKKEQIIIDGFNLEYIKELLYYGQKSAISTKIFEAIIEKLERKEQECEELKVENKKLKEELLDLKLQIEEEQSIYEI